MPLARRIVILLFAVLFLGAALLPHASATPGEALMAAVEPTAPPAGAPAPGNATAEDGNQPSPDAQNSFEQLLDGSLIGNLFFNMPYTGIHLVDVIALVLIAGLFLRTLKPSRPGTDNKNQPPRDFPRSPEQRGGTGRFDPLSGPSPWNRGFGRPERDEGDEPDEPPAPYDPQRQKPRIRPEDLRPPAEYGKPDPRPEDRRSSRPESDSPWQAPPPRDNQPPSPWAGGQPRQAPPRDMKEAASRAWDRFSSKPRATQPNGMEPLAPSGLPADFNSQEFMDGARALYIRLQEAWAARDIADIAAFTTPAMLAVIEEQAKNDPTPTPVHILLVEGQIKGLERQGQEEIVSVLFNTLLRMGTTDPVEVREIWHFSRLLGRSDTWKLDGIEQAA